MIDVYRDRANEVFVDHPDNWSVPGVPLMTNGILLHLLKLTSLVAGGGRHGSEGLANILKSFTRHPHPNDPQRRIQGEFRRMDDPQRPNAARVFVTGVEITPDDTAVCLGSSNLI